MRSQQQKVTGTSSAIEPTGSGPVRIRITEENGQGLVELWLDYEKAEIPARAYFADYVDVVEGRADITFIFGRLIQGNAKLRTQVEISFSRETFLSQLWRSSRDLHTTLRRNSTLRLPQLENVECSGTVHTSRANNVFIATFGEEAILDFYYMSPGDIHFVRVGKRSQVNLDPVIRISAPSALVLEFLDKCDDLALRMPEWQPMTNKEEAGQ